ncbi:hypothetical protein [Actinoplanes sp. CA-252034]|uniref:hypothetical protein n=1 Tax=Actinoplanes sp. CA-252034 TaxID=3239906 RepID=UPI003D985A81
MSDWDRAFHAYGPARGGEELLDVLRHGGEEAYVREYPEAVWQPYSFLWSALYCGGRITPATVLALRYLTDAVIADDFGGTDRTLREAAVWWIRDVARAAVTAIDPDGDRRTAARRDEPAVSAWLDGHLSRERPIFDGGDGSGEVLLAAARADCFDLLPACHARLSTLPGRELPDRLRAALASALATLVAHPRLRHHRDEVVARHTEEARHGTPYHRASMLIGLGELGAATIGWLTDQDVVVRVCAALAPGLATDDAATEVLRRATLDPPALDRDLDGMHLHQMPFHQRAVAEALCSRFDRFDPLVDSAVAAVGYDGIQGPGILAEPYLRKAFPAGLPIRGTAAQRALARTVADHDGLWRDSGSPTRSFARIGLPADRAAWVRAS